MVAYHRPATLERRSRSAPARERDACSPAAPTSTRPRRRAPAGATCAHKDMLDISAVPGLRGIAEEAAGWRIGALDDLDRSDRAPSCRRCSTA